MSVSSLLSFASIFVVAFQVGAATGNSPSVPAGTYKFRGTVRALLRLTVDVIDTRSKDAADRQTQIAKNGGTCQHVSSETLRCTTPRPASEIPPTVLSSIADRLRGNSFKLEAETGSPSKVNVGDALTEWLVSQPGSWSGGKFTQYRYLELTDSLIKLVFPGGSGSLEVIREGEKRFAKFEMLATTESRWRFHEDSALAIFETEP